MDKERDSELQDAVRAATDIIRQASEIASVPTGLEVGPLNLIWHGDTSSGIRIAGYVKYSDTGVSERDGWHMFALPVEDVGTINRETRHISIDLGALSASLMRHKLAIIGQRVREQMALREWAAWLGEAYVKPSMTLVEQFVRDHLNEMEARSRKNRTPDYYTGRMDRLPHWIRHSHGG